MTVKKTDPVQAEAEGVETSTVEWRGITLTFPADPDEWDAEVTLAFEDGKIVSAVRALLGPTQFAQVMAQRPKNRDLAGLYDALAKGMGLSSAGE